MMDANTLRKKYLAFFKAKGHREIPPSPLIPSDDPTTLFTGSGMQQIVPYLKGEPHPMGKRLVDIQPCFRGEDIEEVGDNRHTTFFEMLGNWSLGDYFKKEQLIWFFDFLTKEIGLPAEKLYVTVFAGDKEIPKDEESISVWQKILKTKKIKEGEQGFDPQIKIYTYGFNKNWWSRAGEPQKMPPGEIGGPDSEVFYDFGPEKKIHENSPFRNQPCHLNCDCGRFLEIGNSVFMEYEKTDKGFRYLPQKNVDFGGGLERILAALNNNPDIFATSLFAPVIKKTEAVLQKDYWHNRESIRIIVDHLRAATFMMGEGLEPSNKTQGYILRRLLRRVAIKIYQLTFKPADRQLEDICQEIIKVYRGVYFFDEEKKQKEILKIATEEMRQFSFTLTKGLKLIEKIGFENIDGKKAFDLWQTYGFPLEITQELAAKKGYKVDPEGFWEAFKKHQQLSYTTSQGLFKGGLADHSPIITKLHTATHLLHQALRKILGEEVRQVGSNITAERLRFDFTFSRALTKEEIFKIEELVNQQIKKNLRVFFKITTLEEAKKEGALAFFGQKYPSQVKVYTIGQDEKNFFSKEVCAGPHVNFTGELGKFKIKKEESCGAGKRRIYAVLI